MNQFYNQLYGSYLNEDGHKGMPIGQPMMSKEFDQILNRKVEKEDLR